MKKMKAAVAIAIAVMCFAGAAHAAGNSSAYDVQIISTPEPPPSSPAADPFSGMIGTITGS